MEKSGEAWKMAGISDGIKARVTSKEDGEATCFRKKGRGYPPNLNSLFTQNIGP